MKKQPIDEKTKTLQAIKQYVQPLFIHDTTGHDVEHMKRVAHLASYIAKHEGANRYLCEIAAWLHDVGDDKLFEKPAEIRKDLEKYLQTLEFTSSEIQTIFSIIDQVSFTKGKKIPDSLEGKIVQDADRLDAIGAIGIARTFAYGGANNQPLYDKAAVNSLQHFHDKLFKLKNLMHTTTAKELAKDRHQFMVMYYEQFIKEWNWHKHK